MLSIAPVDLLQSGKCRLRRELDEKMIFQLLIQRHLIAVSLAPSRLF